MENFAVDLDKVLDEFELDEDEQEGGNSYDKLQLEFNERPSPDILGSPKSIGQETWPGSLCGPPPGNRSPPDGQQNDEPEPKSIPLLNSSYTQNLLPIESKNSSIHSNDGCIENDIGKTNEENRNLLWPNLCHNSIIERNLIPVSNAESIKPILLQRPEKNDMETHNNHAPPLDIVPQNPSASESPERLEAQHPDVIDINSKPELLGACAVENSLDQSSQQQEFGNKRDMCLLPDLTFSYGASGFSSDLQNPDLVTENFLHNVSDEPALVQESLCTNRIPEVANVHQSAELGNLPSLTDLPNVAPSVALGNINCTSPIENLDIASNFSDNTSDYSKSCVLPDVSAACEESHLRNHYSHEPSIVKFDPNQVINDQELQNELEELGQVDVEQASALEINEDNSLYAESASQMVVSAVESEVSCDLNLAPESVNCSTSTASDNEISNELKDTASSSVLLNSDNESNIANAVQSILDPSDEVSTESSGTDTTSSSSTLVEGDLESSQFVSEAVTESMRLGAAASEEDSGSGREEGAVGMSVPPESYYEDTSQNATVGTMPPFWIPDDEAPNCQECNMKFTILRRRHHCRACGRVLCANCCHDKAALPYMNHKEARVCSKCLILLTKAADQDQYDTGSQNGRSPNPNNPMEYCSRIPPTQQASLTSSAPPPTVMVPVGILKRENSGASAAHPRARGNKQVIFMDGIQPGGDLSEPTTDTFSPYRRSSRSSRFKSQQQLPGSHKNSRGRFSLRGKHPVLPGLPSDECLIPTNGGLPPVVIQAKIPGEYKFDSSRNSMELNRKMQEEGPPVVFAILRNLTVLVKRVKLDCCIGREVWNLATRGLCTVGQEELVVLLEVEAGETSPPPQIFTFFHTVYQQANKGNLVTELGHTIFTEPEGFLGSKDHVGFLYIRPSLQCMTNLVLPPAPFIFAVLILKWESPWAKVFPLRLMLRLGAEFRYYPCPLVSCRNRKPVFGEIGNTIMNILVDFRNYTYTIPLVQGLLVHMEEKLTTVLIPKNRYEQVWKALDNSNDHVLALSANFSPQADSHLVTREDDDGNYSTQAINIQNRPRKMTGASFIVFNGALNSSSGLKGKSSIVEDGMMVQIPGDTMTSLRDALRNLKDFDVSCGPSSNTKPEQMVLIRWTDDDKNFNIGIKSSVDGRPMDGVPSLKIYSGTDYVSSGYIIRWTEIYIIQGENANGNGDINISRLSESLSRACCVALTSYLKELYKKGQTKLALRATIHQENVEYVVGSGGNKLPPACHSELDTELIPVIHQAATNITDQPIILELVFHVLEQ